jgi:hypothetical protein
LLARSVTHPNVCRIYDLGLHRGPSGEVLIGICFGGVYGRWPCVLPNSLAPWTGGVDHGGDRRRRRVAEREAWCCGLDHELSVPCVHTAVPSR